jgi:hypothetical protein
MNSSSQTRVPHHRRSRIATTLCCALRATALLCLCSALPAAYAQSAPCGISFTKTWKSPIYPPIARAARVSGAVVMLVQFDRAGTPLHVDVVSGPQMLRKVALESASIMQVNEFTGPRECPVVVNFSIGDCEQPSKWKKAALPRMSVCAEAIILSDPAFTITRRHSFLFFHWTTTPKVTDLAALSKV